MLSGALTTLAAALFYVGYATAGLTTITNWGDNPTGLNLQAYVPNKVASKPAIILALHPCGGSSSQYAGMTKYGSLAESKGFIVLFPGTTKDFNCWDVASAKSLTHNGGGDSTGLANIVQWALRTYGGDAARVFVTGSSSGCMMTNVMSATYPELFAASSCYSGVAAGCLAGSPGASPISADPRCAAGQIVKTGAEWAAQARAMYPGYAGAYPRVLVWHGTADTFVNYPNMAEQLKQWSAIHGVAFARNVTNTPQSGYTQMVYGDGTKLLGYSAAGVGHTVPVHEDVDLQGVSGVSGSKHVQW